MAFAPTSTYFVIGDSSIIGGFEGKKTSNFFEFSDATLEERLSGWAHRIWVTTPWENDRGYRLGEVLKTVVYIVLDENDDGSARVEKWPIKKYTKYPRVT